METRLATSSMAELLSKPPNLASKKGERHNSIDVDDYDPFQACNRCQAMTGTLEGLVALLDEDRQGYEHYNWEELQDSMHTGCALCGDICNAISKAWEDEYDEVSMSDRVRVFAGSYPSETTRGGKYSQSHPLARKELDFLYFEVPNDPSRPESLASKQLYLMTYEGDPASTFVPGRRATTDFDRSLVNRARAWLDECQDSHEKCPKRCIPLLPSRVIDVGENTDSAVKLHISQSGERAPYVALSYCWGGPQPLVTTKQNINAHTRAIPAHILPKTISEAIIVSRKMGIRFLWVDALCIMQDDVKDKAKVDNYLVKLPFYLDEGSSGTVYIKSNEGEHNWHEDDTLFTRGWTLQEMLLSPRMLIFDSNQLILKCREIDYESALPTYITSQHLCDSLPPPVFGIPEQSFVKIQEEWHLFRQSTLWPELIEKFSMRDLSIYSDRLPALAGIAHELSLYWGGTYVAGFWKDVLNEHLAWKKHFYRPSDPKFPGLDITKRIGRPTWSWATLPHGVQFHRVEVPEARIVDCTVEPTFPEVPFGQVNGGTVTVEAQVLKASDIPGFWELRRLKEKGVAPTKSELFYDFPDSESVVKTEDIRFVFLGHAYTYRPVRIFLMVCRVRGGRYERMGLARLFLEKREDSKMWALARKEITVIE